MSDTATRFLQRWFVVTLGVLVATKVVDGISTDSITTLLVTSLLLGLANAFLRPVLLLFSIPLLLVTLGLFYFVINGLLLWLVGSLVRGFHVAGFWPAFWGGLIISLVGGVANVLLGVQVKTHARKTPAPKPSNTISGSGKIIDV